MTKRCEHLLHGLASLCLCTFPKITPISLSPNSFFFFLMSTCDWAKLNWSSSAQQNKGVWIAVICLAGRTMARKMQHPECYHMLIMGTKCFRNTGNTLCLNTSSKAYMASSLLLLQPRLASTGMPDPDKIIERFCCAGKSFVMHLLRRAGGDAHPQKKRDCTIPFVSHLNPKKSSLLSQR